MEEKQLLDKDGNVLTKERIEEVMKSIFINNDLLIQKCEWEEDGQICHTWKINTGKSIMYTNDTGIEKLKQALKKDILNNYKNGKI